MGEGLAVVVSKMYLRACYAVIFILLFGSIGGFAKMMVSFPTFSISVFAQKIKNPLIIFVLITFYNGLYMKIL